jgi:hypothetical protein
VDYAPNWADFKKIEGVAQISQQKLGRRLLNVLIIATLAAPSALQERRQDLEALAAHLVAEGRNSVVEGEPDARPMRMATGAKPPCYNVQTAADADTGSIVHHDVTTKANDTRLLYPMAKATKEEIGAEALTVVADAGFSNGAGAAACEAEGIVPCVPSNRSVNKEADGTLLDRSAFTYEPETDSYRCPRGAHAGAAAPAQA